MHQAQVNNWGDSPQYVEVSELELPKPDEIRLKVDAVGLHRVVRSRAAGKHYSSAALPHVPGVDGTGTTEDGRKVYFFSFAVGGMAEHVNMPKNSIIPLPEGVNPLQTAGIVNPAMSSWMAFKSRTSNLPKEFTVLKVGATSASGRVAIPLASSLGAERVIGVARNQAALDTLDLDDSIIIEDEIEKTDFSSLGDVDVILDYVYGPLTEHLFKSLKTTKPVEYVHIGALASMTINLPGDVLRSKNLTIRGSGPGAWSFKEVVDAIPDILAALKQVPEQPIKVVKLADVEKEWKSSGSERVVFVP